MSKSQVSGAQIYGSNEVLVARASEGASHFSSPPSRDACRVGRQRQVLAAPIPGPLAIGVRPLGGLWGATTEVYIRPESVLSVHGLVTSCVDSRAAHAATNSGRRYWHPNCF
jgi:hypothetical protein